MRATRFTVWHSSELSVLFGFLLAFLLGGAFVGAVRAGEEWPQFRGPSGDGISDATGVPQKWSAEDNIRWRVDVPGVGWSQPIIVDGKVIVTTAVAEGQPRPKIGEAGPGFNFFSGEGLSRLSKGGEPPKDTYQWQLRCYDLESGDEAWSRVILESRPQIATHRSNSYASETPVTDGERVYVHIAMVGIYCFDLDGKPVWQQELKAAPMLFGWGTGSSPVLDKERLYVICDNERESYLLALDKLTGDERWQKKRDEPSNWSTPYLWHNKERVELVTTGGKKMRSYHPDSGELIWELPGGGRTSTTAVGNRDLLVVGSVSRSTGRRGNLVAIRAGATGDLSGQQGAEHIVWTQRSSAPEIASPVLSEGKLFTLQQQGGLVRCLDAASGELLYRERLPRASGFTASPVAVGGHIYCLDERGQTTILAADATLKVVATNNLDGMFWSSPAIVDGRILLRSDKQLICVGKE